MAIKVGGTEVVSNSRELKNIATIDSGTVTAFNSALNTDPTKGTLTKTFVQNETAEITLSSNVTVGPVVSVTKEVPQTGVSTKGNWDVNSTASNYDLHNTAANVTLTPTSTANFAATSNAANSFTQSSSAYNSEVGGAYPQGFSWAGNGMYYYIANGKDIYRYELTTAYDLTTASLSSNQSFDTAGTFNQDIADLYVTNDGTKLFTVHGSNSKYVSRYTMSTAHDLANMSYSNNVNLQSHSGNTLAVPNSVTFKPDGTIMYITDHNSAIFSYSINPSYPFNMGYVTGQTGAEGFGSEISNSSGVRGSAFTSDGTKMYILDDSASENIVEYSLSTAWDITTKSYTNNSFHYKPLLATHLDNVPSLTLINDNAFVFLDNNHAKVRKVTMGATNSLVLGSGSFASTDVGKRIVGNGGDVILTATSGTFDTTGGSAFTDSSTIAAGSWSMFGLKSAGDADGITLAGVTQTGALDINAATYTSKTKNIAQDNDPRGLRLNNDGTKMFVMGNQNDEVFEYSLSTAYDVSTANYGNISYVLNGPTNSLDVLFNNDGTKMYVPSSSPSPSRVYEYNLTTPFSLSSGVSTGNTLNISGQGGSTSCHGITFNNDGTKFYAAISTSTVYQYNLTTAYDISTASYSNKSYNASNYVNDISGVNFNSDGTSMYLFDNAADAFYQYSLTTAYDISTASYANKSLATSARDSESEGFCFADNFTKLYIVGSSNNRVYQYDTAFTETFIQPTAQYNVAVTNTSGRIDSSAFTDINGMTAAQSAGTGTVNYAVSTDGRTTWSVNKGTDGVRPIVRNNSGTWQYNNNAGTSNSNDLSVAAYNNDSFTFSNVGGTYTVGAFWSTDGTKVFIMKGNYVAEARLTTAYDLSTATYQDNHDLNSQDAYPFGFWMNSTGTRMYVNGGSNDTIFQYSLSTGFDISGLSYIGNSVNVQAQDTENRGIWFGPENASNEPTKMFMVGGANNTVYEYNFTSPGSLSSTSYNNVSFSVASQQGDCSGLSFSADGTKMFIIGRSPEGVHQYNLTTAWDISSASYANIYYDTTGFITTPYSGSVSSNGEHLVIADESSGYIYNISIGGSSYATTATWANGTVNDELYTLQQALTAQSHNRMDKTQLDAIPDANHFATGTSLDLMIALRLDTAASTLPTSDGVTLNYDAAVLNEGAVLGTDYDFFHPAANKVQIKSLAAQNLKVRVV